MYVFVISSCTTSYIRNGRLALPVVNYPLIDMMIRSSLLLNPQRGNLINYKTRWNWLFVTHHLYLRYELLELDALLPRFIDRRQKVIGVHDHVDC